MVLVNLNYDHSRDNLFNFLEKDIEMILRIRHLGYQDRYLTYSGAILRKFAYLHKRNIEKPYQGAPRWLKGDNWLNEKNQ